MFPIEVRILPTFQVIADLNMLNQFFNTKIFDFFEKNTPKNSFHEYRIKLRNYNFILFDTNIKKITEKILKRLSIIL